MAVLREGEYQMKRFNRITSISTGLITLFLCMPAKAIEWEPVHKAHGASHSKRINWERVDDSKNPPKPIIWTATDEDPTFIPGDKRNKITPSKKRQHAHRIADIQNRPPAPVTGGLYQVQRNDEWLPSISQRIPTGFGSTFGTAQLGLFMESCNVTGNYVCGSQSREDEFKSNAKGILTLFAGLGNPNEWVGIDLGLQITSLATTRPSSTTPGKARGSGRGLDLSISRNINPDLGIKIAAYNLAALDEVQLDQGRSAYAVASTRIDLGGHPDENTYDLYLTGGVANGIYRPLNAIIEDQTRECTKDIERYGRRTTYKYGDHCNERGLNYGTPWPIASAAFVLNPQVSLIAEWWGRNLTLAASIKPFEELNWVITPGITNLVVNSDWDPQYPGYTETNRFHLTTSIGF